MKYIRLSILSISQSRLTGVGCFLHPLITNKPAGLAVYEESSTASNVPVIKHEEEH
jgi:hypothetical protein